MPLWQYGLLASQMMFNGYDSMPFTVLAWVRYIAYQLGALCNAIPKPIPLW
jgi:hypothetical protein